MKEKRNDGKERKIEIEEESKRKAEGYGGKCKCNLYKCKRGQRVMKCTRRTTFLMHRPREQENERFIPNYNPHRFEYC